MYGVQDIGCDLMGMDRSGTALRKNEFWANEGISFELKRGECLGLIGKNGAGKTTLLKMLNGLIKPDQGTITMHGKVGALIALGAGFNPILTGKENIYINGSVLGLSKKEVESKFDEIIEFADIGDFLDSPVQSYSSGMQVRLGFAVATAMNPDILLVDEVLAVGDTSFKVKCYNKIKELLPKTAVIFVSHNMFDVSRVSTSCIVMKKGKSLYQGSVPEGVHAYNDLNNDNKEAKSTKLKIHTDSGFSNVIVKKLTTSDDGPATTLDLNFGFESDAIYENMRVRLVVFNDKENAVAEWDSSLHDLSYAVVEGGNQIEVHVDNIRLVSGCYKISVVFTHSNNNGYCISIERGLNFSIKNKSLGGAPYKL